eukprot:CAMPEP_0201581800 /NCGR_PEP_ID=MMETSP0190_2-20130828/75324_1 /ASSEMBLY_ACC=CAM_ASM_000263 /TAXON_ID=37353 /ORGANISM="Rosalina sp." /LENGTH=65 /DNA_ID=CAMNT_0048020479 /DNA_START=15 /DNA_END=209 /DNA_ORIENTATION=+
MKEEFQRLEAPPAEAGAQYLNDSMHSLQNDASGNKEAEMKLSEHWSRYFITELVGTYIATLMGDG